MIENVITKLNLSKALMATLIETLCISFNKKGRSEQNNKESDS